MLGELLLNRRVDDRIRELSAKAVRASDDEAGPVLQELLRLMREKLNKVRNMAATHMIEGKNLKDRRSDPDPDRPVS